MIDLLALLATLVAVVNVVRLRYFLAKRFPTIRARELPAGTGLPPAYADLAAEAHAALAALGCDGPYGYLIDGDPADAIMMRCAALYRDRDAGTLVELYPSVNAASPNRLSSVAATRLVDGRLLISQANDIYYEMMATPRVMGRMVVASTPEQLLEAHRRWVATVGTAPDPGFTDAAARLDFIGDWHNRMRDALVDEGRLWRDRGGSVRAGALLALRMMWRALRMPKAVADGRPTPPARLAALAAVAEQVRHAEPPLSAQWALFGTSLLLFAVGGAVFWDLQFALLLLLVIFLHELGHFAAMRALGYRNVHMLALPLVGGVTLGQEVHPSAARRAWMSLMGPLPGIVIGWSLLLLPLPAALNVLQPHAQSAALVFLVINYLNLLPMPPLDGGHVVQAMLPPRWYGVQALFVAVACVLGAVASIAAGFYLLAGLAVFQLVGLRAVLDNGRALRVLLAEGVPPRTQPRVLRLARVFDLLQRIRGAPRGATARIQQAEALLRAADQEPMSWGQRLVIGGVMAGALVVPVGGLLVPMLSSMLMSMAVAARPRVAVEEIYRIHGDVERQSRSMSVRELVETVRPRSARSAADDGLSALRSRLGVELPTELVGIVTVADGLPSLPLAPIDDWRIALDDDFTIAGTPDALQVLCLDGQHDLPQAVPIGKARAWLLLSGGSETPGRWYYDLAAVPSIPGCRAIFVHQDGAVAYADLTEKLRKDWMVKREVALIRAARDAPLRSAREAMRSDSIEQIVARFQRPGRLQRLLLNQPDWPEPADVDSLTSANQRLGLALPKELVEVLRLHDGMPSVPLLPSSEIRSVHDWRAVDPQDAAPDWAVMFDRDFATGGDADAPTEKLSIDELDRCFVIGASGSNLGRDPPGPAHSLAEMFPMVLWCPESGSSAARVIDLTEGRIRPNLRELLIDRVVQQDG